MLPLYRVLLAAHVAVGFAGLVAFWFPVLSRKGGSVHVRAGKVFLGSAWVVAVSALAIGLMDIAVPFAIHPEERPGDPAQTAAVAAQLRGIGAFLAYLAVVTLASVHHGVRSIQHGRRPEGLRTPFHTGLNALAVLAGAAVLVLGLASGRTVFLLLAPIGPLVGVSNLRYARRPARERMGHWYEHLAGMIGAGIAFHTAFAVFGGARILGLGGLDGPWAFLPWVLPAAIGAPATALWQRHYRAKFEGRKARELAAAG